MVNKSPPINLKLSWTQNSPTVKLMNEQHSCYLISIPPESFSRWSPGIMLWQWKAIKQWLQKVWKVEKSSTLEEPWPINESEVWFWLLIIIDKLEPTVIFWPQTQINQLKTTCSCSMANQFQALQDDPWSPTSPMSWVLCSICFSDSRSNTHLILYPPTNHECC